MDHIGNKANKSALFGENLTIRKRADPRKCPGTD